MNKFSVYIVCYLCSGAKMHILSETQTENYYS